MVDESRLPEPTVEPSRRGAVRRRLTPTDRAKDLLPWVRAHGLKPCELYWVSAPVFPIPAVQRHWLLSFFRLFSATMARERGVSAEVFLQMKTIHPHLANTFIKTAPEFSPVFGLSRGPNEPLPALPDMEYVEDLQKGRRSYDANDGKPNYCYWFLNKAEDRQCELFLGYGGLTWVYVKPDPKQAAPEVRIPPRVLKKPGMRALIERHDLQKILNSAYAMQSGFLSRSKEMFGVDLKNEPMFPGLPFILPLLNSTTFFSQQDEQICEWFSLFDIYVHESVEDGGVLLASREPIEDQVIELVRVLRERETPHSDKS